MPKVIPVPDAFSQPFWDAVNAQRLGLQHCAACDRLQYPPRVTCATCGAAEQLAWKAVNGRGHIAASIVIEDGRLERRIPDQPYHLALIMLDEDPGINVYANLPGTPVNEVPVGAAVEVIFEEVAPGQLIHEWQVVRSSNRPVPRPWRGGRKDAPWRRRSSLRGGEIKQGWGSGRTGARSRSPGTGIPRSTGAGTAPPWTRPWVPTRGSRASGPWRTRGVTPDQIDGVLCCPEPIAGASGGVVSNWAPRPYFAPPYDSEWGLTRVNAAWLVRQMGLPNVTYAPANVPAIGLMMGLAAQSVADGLCTTCLVIYSTGNLAGRYRRGGENAEDYAAGARQWTVPWGHHGGNDFMNIFPHAQYGRTYGGPTMIWPPSSSTSTPTAC